MPARSRKLRDTNEDLRAVDVVRIATHQEHEIADDVPAAPVKNPAASRSGSSERRRAGMREPSR